MSYRWLLNPRWLLFIPVLVVLVIGVACGGDDATSTPQPTATPVPQPTATAVPVAEPTSTAPPVMAKLEPKYGGIVPMQAATGSPARWDPHKATAVEDLQVVAPMYNQLLEYNPIKPTELIGDLAKSWAVSDDGLSFIFDLRDDVKWLDGRELTADDVVFSINRMNEEGALRPNTDKLKPYMDRIEKVDKYTVRVHMKYPSEAFLKFLGADYFKILPEHHVSTLGDDFEIAENSTVTSGPFKFVEYTHGDSFALEKNPDYFKERRPYFDGIKGFFITDKGTEIAAYKTERILMSMSVINQLDVEDVLRLQADEEFMSRFDTYWMKGAHTLHVILYTKNPPFDDPMIRRALDLAVNRQELSDGFGLGNWSIGTHVGPTSPYALPEAEILQMPGYRLLNGKKHPDDIAEANRLLKVAGYDANNPLKVELAVPGIIYFPDVAQVVAEQFRNLEGLEVNLSVREWAASVLMVQGGDFEMVLWGIADTVPDPDDSFKSAYLEGSKNASKWTNPMVTELWNKQSRELDFEKRKALNYEMQRIVMKEAPGLLPLVWASLAQIVNKRIMTEAGQFVPHVGIYSRLKHDHEWLEPN